jgi:heptosyltransferase-1
VNRILIVKLGALGDVVHAIPVAAALRRAFPSARIDWLVGPKHREILDLVPVIDRRLVLNDSRALAAVRELRANRYDVAIDLQGLIKSALLTRASGAARVVGFTSRYAREPLASWFYGETHDPGGGGMYHIDERHVVDTNLGILETLGVRRALRSFRSITSSRQWRRWLPRKPAAATRF